MGEGGISLLHRPPGSKKLQGGREKDAVTAAAQHEVYHEVFHHRLSESPINKLLRIYGKNPHSPNFVQ